MKRSSKLSSFLVELVKLRGASETGFEEELRAATNKLLGDGGALAECCTAETRKSQ